MSNLKEWIGSQEVARPYDQSSLTRLKHPDKQKPFPNHWSSPSTNKLMAYELPKKVDPNKTVVLGGMCLLTTIDMKLIYKKELTFRNITEFKRWFASWYPRIDQIHDTVCIPPKVAPQVIYVSEDSFFADRLSSYTGLDKTEIQKVLRDVHEQQGHPVLKQYLRTNGYKGEVNVVYTSDIDNELEVALKMWERMLGKKFRGADKNFAKVELMYTGFWLDILGVQSAAMIFEAASKMILKGYLKLDDWFKLQQYGTNMNSDLGIAGYLPFLTTQGDAGNLKQEQVPNFGNKDNFQISDEELEWFIVNLLYAKKDVKQEGPQALDPKQAKEMIANDLNQYYKI